MRDHLHVLFHESTSGDSRRTHTHARGHERLLGVVGNGVLVDRDVHLIQPLLHLLARDVHGTQVHQHEVVVGAARHQLKALLQKSRSQRLGVENHLMLIRLEGLVQRLAEANRLTGNDVLQRTALDAGENGLVDLLGDLLIVREDQTAARAAQGLVGGGGHHIGIGNGGRMLTGSDKTGDVRHVHHQVCADRVGNVSHARKVNHAGVGRRTGHDQLGLDLLGLGLQLIVVDDVGVVLHAVGNEVVVQTREVDGGTVGQVSAVGKAHAHHGVTGLEQGDIHSRIGLRAGVGLNVGVLCAEQLASALNGDVLNHIHALATAVVTFGRVSLGVLVGQHTADRHHDSLGDNVLGSDQLKPIPLTGKFGINSRGYFGIAGGEVSVHFLNHGVYHPSL